MKKNDILYDKVRKEYCIILSINNFNDIMNIQYNDLDIVWASPKNSNLVPLIKYSRDLFHTVVYLDKDNIIREGTVFLGFVPKRDGERYEQTHWEITPNWDLLPDSKVNGRTDVIPINNVYYNYERTELINNIDKDMKQKFKKGDIVSSLSKIGEIFRIIKVHYDNCFYYDIVNIKNDIISNNVIQGILSENNDYEKSEIYLSRRKHLIALMDESIANCNYKEAQIYLDLLKKE